MIFWRSSIGIFYVSWKHFGKPEWSLWLHQEQGYGGPSIGLSKPKMFSFAQNPMKIVHKLPNFSCDRSNFITVLISKIRCKLWGTNFCGGKSNCCFGIILKELFHTFNLVFLWNLYLHFNWDMGVQNWGPKTPTNKILWTPFDKKIIPNSR